MALIEPLEYRVAKALLTCLCAELDANNTEDPTLGMPARCCLRAGNEILFDITNGGVDLCCEGEAYVKIIDVYPSSSFPQRDEPNAQPCNMSRYTMALELGVLRCLPDSPDCDESDFGVRRNLADRMAAVRAACCWATQIKGADLVGRGAKWFADGWATGGPDGQCITGTMPLFVSLPGVPDSGCC